MRSCNSSEGGGLRSASRVKELRTGVQNSRRSARVARVARVAIVCGCTTDVSRFDRHRARKLECIAVGVMQAALAGNGGLNPSEGALGQRVAGVRRYCCHIRHIYISRGLYRAAWPCCCIQAVRGSQGAPRHQRARAAALRRSCVQAFRPSGCGAQPSVPGCAVGHRATARPIRTAI